MVQSTLATKTYFYMKQTRIKLKHIKDDFKNSLKSMKMDSQYFNMLSVSDFNSTKYIWNNGK